MNKTRDIEDAIAVALLDGLLPVEAVETHRLVAALQVDDRRWIAVALMHLERDGRIRYVGCDPRHNHVGSCVIEVAQ